MVESITSFLISIFGDQHAEIIHYLFNGKHLAWYASVQYNLLAGIFGALFAVFFGLLGAGLKLSSFKPFHWLGTAYINIMRGLPDLLVILFFPLAIEYLVEWVIAKNSCSAAELASTKWPPCDQAQWLLSTSEYLILASAALGIVYGSFAANVIYGAMNTVPKGQLEAASAYGFNRRQIFWKFQIRQMWVYALPGLSNVWVLLLKATSFLSLLQIADVVLWAERLGAPNYFPRVGMVHPDWRWKYYLVVFFLYIFLTYISEIFFSAVTKRVSHGMVRES